MLDRDSQHRRYSSWNSVYVENHDQARFISRICEDHSLLEESAGLVATMLLTLKGTPYIYQGQEIGISNVAFNTIDDYQDIWTVNHYNESLELGHETQDILERIHYRSFCNECALEYLGFRVQVQAIHCND